MSRSLTEKKRFRKNLGSIREIVEVPDLITLQKKSYESFVQTNVEDPDMRENKGLQEVFKSIFPIKDYSGKAELDFCSYTFDEPKYEEDECRKKGITYSAPLRAKFRLIVWDVDAETGARTIRDIKEQDVYMGDLPIMTDHGSFIINGVERVIVSQMQRSPGLLFDHDNGKNCTSGKYLYAAHIIPVRGSWLDFEFDEKDILFAKIDRKKKILVSTFLMALDSARTEKLRAEKGADLDYMQDVQGMTREEILGTFYSKYTVENTNGMWRRVFNPEEWIGTRIDIDFVNADTGNVVLESGRKVHKKIAEKLVEDGLKYLKLDDEDVLGCFLAEDIIDESNGLVLFEAGEAVTITILEALEERNITSINLLNIDYVQVGPYLRNVLALDKNNSREEALFEIFRVMRPGEPVTLEAAEELFRSMFFDDVRYDLSIVGRVKIDQRLGRPDGDKNFRVLSKKDIIDVIKVLLDLKDGRGEIDDIDNLGNRRVRAVGELLENQFRVGLVRLERTIRERIGAVEVENTMPNELMNSKPVSSLIREFFGTSQLSQFMDQVNPLTEITHKRRLSALGPGGLSRERAGFEVRDVHPTHYGRICPVETPEGPNIGLITSMATYAKVNEYGFIETPYRKVVNRQVTDEIIYLTATEEARHFIAQAKEHIDSKGKIVNEFVVCRNNGDVVNVPGEQIDLIDISSRQLLSVSASLIPFFENDDASRALMGCNMQRQAVPLVKPSAPLVGTGIERVVAKDSGVVIVAQRDGVVEYVDSAKIIVKAQEEVKASKSSSKKKQDSEEAAQSIVGVDIYKLRKYDHTNQSTCINQKPIVKKGDLIKKGDIIADGIATDCGELALGNNVLVAFMSWNGYNFEDSILVSEKLIADGKFSSIHIEEFELLCRDTKLGNEEITRDIPNVSDDALRNLDDSGVVCIGAKVNPGDILIGKVTPKGESLVTPEEKLLRAIFGERSSDVSDSSLRVPPGVKGTVVDVKIYSRRGIEKDERTQIIERREIDELIRNRDAERGILTKFYYSSLARLLKDQVVKSFSGKGILKKGTVLDEDVLKTIQGYQLDKIIVDNELVNENIASLKKEFDKRIKNIQKQFEKHVDKVKSGEDLQSGVIKVVKVYLAVCRKLTAGDKMAGRHGNKGVVSRVVPVEDMPYLEDGTPVDMVLSPLGVPSRMNIGQILEIHLGSAAYGLGKQIDKVLRNMSESDEGIVQLRKELKNIYDAKDEAKDIDVLSDYEVVEMATNLTKGVPFAIPVFDSPNIAKIEHYLELAGCDKSGQTVLYDGRTGQPFDKRVTVGYMYMLKLNHMVDDKMHARSIGPYSLVTQQPLGGKAQFGGQRFGEMEVWALEAYGASYLLQEMLTVKSDDIAGRTNAYNSIVSGFGDIETGIPESFNVLVKELKSLALNVEFLKSKISEDSEVANNNG